MCLIPEAFRELERRARRAARCIECGRGIAVGARYLLSSGVWEGVPASYKTCQRCARLRRLAQQAGYGEDSGCGITFGGLFESIREYLGTRGWRRRRAAGLEDGAAGRPGGAR